MNDDRLVEIFNECGEKESLFYSVIEMKVSMYYYGWENNYLHCVRRNKVHVYVVLQ